MNPFEFFRSRQSELLAELCELIEIETPTFDAAAISRFVTHLRSKLEAAGVACEELDGENGPCLYGTMEGTGEGADGGDLPAIALVGHSDTVWPHGTTAVRPPTERDGKLFGPGIYDMKGGDFLMLCAVRYFHEHGIRLRRPLQVFISVDEEKGSVTSHPWMDKLLDPSATALVPEPPCPNGDLKIERKGVGIYGLEITGREAHAGAAPEQGVSAIDELARVIAKLHSWTDRETGVSLNVGRVEGGTSSNVVAGRAHCEIDLRYVRPEQGEQVDARIRALEPRHPDAVFEFFGGLFFPPLVPTDRSREEAQIACDVAKTLGLDIGFGSSGGGSDGSYLASRGLTVIDGLGIDGAGAHAVDEHIVVDRFAVRAALFTQLILALDER